MSQKRGCDNLSGKEKSPAPAKKKHGSQSPNVIVRVGKDDSAKDFPCCKLILCKASEHFDELLEAQQDIIELPNMDPDVWEEFYQIITPEEWSTPEEWRVGVGAEKKIKKDNVLTLLPWFHEFKIYHRYYLQKCDEKLTGMWTEKYSNYTASNEKVSRFWNKIKCSNESNKDYQARLEERKEMFLELCNDSVLAKNHGLSKAKELVGGILALLLNRHSELHMVVDDLFDLSVVETLVHMVIPLELKKDDNGNTELRMANKEGCESLWKVFKEIIQPRIKTLTSKLCSKTWQKEALPSLVYEYMQYEKLKSAGVSIIKYRRDCFANAMCIKARQLPNTRSLRNFEATGGKKIDEYIKGRYKQAYDEHRENAKNEFELFGIE